MAAQPPIIYDLELKGGAIVLDFPIISPIYTLWNLDGWANLDNVASRTYDTWDVASGNNPPSYVGAEAVMFDTYNKKYYKLMFTQLTQSGSGGGFSYVRQQILGNGFFGTPVYFTHSDFGNEVDFIDNKVAITRNVNQGIYNPLMEPSYNGSNSRSISYRLIVPSVNNQSLLNNLDNQVIEECYIVSNQQIDGGVTFLLPTINSLKLAWNPKIYIYNPVVATNKVVVAPIDATFNEGANTTTINGSINSSVLPDVTTYFHVVAPNMWMGLRTFNGF